MDINYYKKFEPIDGKWYISKELGSGAFGTVFEVERRDFSTTKSAMKIISIPNSQSEVESFREENYDLDENSVTSYFYGFVEEFVKEFQLMSKLRGHSNIVSYEDHDVVKREDSIGWDIFIRMELLTPMNKYFANNAPKQSDIIKLGIDICKALEVCQKYKIIHRDIKPSNIFVSETGDFKLGDFGVARTLEKTSSGLSKKGTYIYMAPEVYKGEEYGSNVDIYSLGIVMYKMLNNNMEPFRNDRTHSAEENAMALRIKGECPIPKPANAEGRLAEIVLKACRFDPKERYESPLQMREELENILYTESEAKVIYTDGDEVAFEPSTAGKIHEIVSKEEKTTGIFESTEKKDVTVGLFDNKNEKLEKEQTVGFFDKEKTRDNKEETVGIFDVEEKKTNPPQNQDVKENKKPKGKIAGVIASLLAVIIVLICFVLLSGSEVTGIDNLPEEIVLTFEQQLQLEPMVLPENTKCTIAYSIDDSNIATVDENGKITAKSEVGFTKLNVVAGKYEMEISVEVTDSIDALALEEKYKEAKELLETVSNDTTINQANVQGEKLGVQQTLDSLDSIDIEDISEQELNVLVNLFDINYVQSMIDRLNAAYEKAKEIANAESNNVTGNTTKQNDNTGSNKTGNSSGKTTTQKKCSVCGSTAHTNHPTCAVCGSTSHTSHPTCPVCGSTSHTTHPQQSANCPVCGSKYHSVHPSSDAPEITVDVFN